MNIWQCNVLNQWYEIWGILGILYVQCTYRWMGFQDFEPFQHLNLRSCIQIVLSIDKKMDCTIYFFSCLSIQRTHKKIEFLQIFKYQKFSIIFLLILLKSSWFFLQILVGLILLADVKRIYGLKWFLVIAYFFTFTYFDLQVNFFQKHLFWYQLTHSLTKDWSLNYEFSTWNYKLSKYILCTQIVLNVKTKNILFIHHFWTCSFLVLNS